MNPLDEPCICGHIRARHAIDEKWKGGDFCQECCLKVIATPFPRAQVVPTDYCQHFYLDNMKYVELTNHEKAS